MLGLLSVVVSLDAERGLSGAGLSSRGAWFSCPMARGISPDQDWNACPLIGRWTPKHWTTREVPKFTIIIFSSKIKKYSVNLLMAPTSKSQGA